MKEYSEWFGMRVSPADRAIFRELAQRLNRTESEALRLVAREVVQALKAQESVNIPHPAEPAQV